MNLPLRNYFNSKLHNRLLQLLLKKQTHHKNGYVKNKDIDMYMAKPKNSRRISCKF